MLTTSLKSQWQGLCYTGPCPEAPNSGSSGLGRYPTCDLQWDKTEWGAWAELGVCLFQWCPNASCTGLMGEKWNQAQGLLHGGRMRWSAAFNAPSGKWLEGGSRRTCHMSWRYMVKSGVFEDPGSEEGGHKGGGGAKSWSQCCFPSGTRIRIPVGNWMGHWQG